MTESIIDTRFENRMKSNVKSNVKSNLNSVGYMNTIIDQFKINVDSLEANGWQFVKTQYNHLIMNKQYQELDEINIEYKNGSYHFYLPIKNSAFCFYKKIADEQQASQFFEQQTSSLIQY